jgi:hypothetical protein
MTLSFIMMLALSLVLKVRMARLFTKLIQITSLITRCLLWEVSRRRPKTCWMAISIEDALKFSRKERQ